MNEVRCFTNLLIHVLICFHEYAVLSPSSTGHRIVIDDTYVRSHLVIHRNALLTLSSSATGLYLANITRCPLPMDSECPHPAAVLYPLP